MGGIWDAYGERKARRVLAETWGYPKPQTKYPVEFILANDEDHNITVLKENADDWTDLGNPFFHNDKMQWLSEIMFAPFTFWQWTGYYWKYKNENFRFTGKFKQLYLREK